MGDSAVTFASINVDCGWVGGNPWAVKWQVNANSTNDKGVWGPIATRGGGATSKLDRPHSEQ